MDQISPILSAHSKKPLLTAEEELRLAILSQKGDLDARKVLVESNLRFVVSMALKYRHYGIPISELVAEGNLALMIAAAKFDPDHGTRFVTYAGYWIRALLLELIIKDNRIVMGGNGPFRSKIFFKLRRERARLETVIQDRDKLMKVLAKRLDSTPEQVERYLQQLDAKDVSLDTPVREVDSEATLLDQISGADIYGEKDSEEQFISAEQEAKETHWVQVAMKSLDPREKYILEHRYMNDEEESLAEIGRQLGVSRERARQIEVRAKTKLRQQLQSHMAYAA